MKDYMGSIMLSGLLALSLSGGVLADGQLDKETLETLIKGNTIEGMILKWKSSYKTYFDPSGKYGRIDSKNNKEGGVWKVEKDGSLTMVGRKEKRRIIKQRDDGGYDVYNHKGQVTWTIDKITPGNPYNLEPPDTPPVRFGK